MRWRESHPYILYSEFDQAISQSIGADQYVSAYLFFYFSLDSASELKQYKIRKEKIPFSLEDSGRVCDIL